MPQGVDQVRADEAGPAHVTSTVLPSSFINTWRGKMGVGVHGIADRKCHRRWYCSGTNSGRGETILDALCDMLQLGIAQLGVHRQRQASGRQRPRPRGNFRGDGPGIHIGRLEWDERRIMNRRRHATLAELHIERLWIDAVQQHDIQMPHVTTGVDCLRQRELRNASQQLTVTLGVPAAGRVPLVQVAELDFEDRPLQPFHAGVVTQLDMIMPTVLPHDGRRDRRTRAATLASLVTIAPPPNAPRFLPG